ncbi:MAG: polyphosphate polymerase domain-containing protein [Lachnospiraceae bacterium]|nr:polyphosphate polymerase domain-containing protein [Lachnospiraceae bacterium]
MNNGYQSTFQRIEIKYLLSDIQYRALRARLRDIAEVDAYGRTSILNIYYDTPDDTLIRRSLEKPVYKEKLRLRTYGTPSDRSPAFVEIKKKYNGVVYKRRVSLPYDEACEFLNGKQLNGRQLADTRGLNAQIIGEIEYFKDFYKKLAPAMVISYDRIAMAGIGDKGLRLTFDDHIRYRTGSMDLRAGNGGRELLSPGQHLLELKVDGAIPLELAHIFADLHIVPCSFSKYGRGYEDRCRRSISVKKRSAA